jgi:hypothetical protein
MVSILDIVDLWVLIIFHLLERANILYIYRTYCCKLNVIICTIMDQCFALACPPGFDKARNWWKASDEGVFCRNDDDESTESMLLQQHNADRMHNCFSVSRFIEENPTLEVQSSSSSLLSLLHSCGLLRSASRATMKQAIMAGSTPHIVRHFHADGVSSSVAHVTSSFREDRTLSDI